jgi:hypothetical protein
VEGRGIKEEGGKRGRGQKTRTRDSTHSTAMINAIQFAAFGTPSGQCGSYVHDKNCDASNATRVVESLCLGKSTCSVPSYPEFGDPCYGTYKKLIIQATCSGNGGG